MLYIYDNRLAPARYAALALKIGSRLLPLRIEDRFHHNDAVVPDQNLLPLKARSGVMCCPDAGIATLHIDAVEVRPKLDGRIRMLLPQEELAPFPEDTSPGEV